MNSKFNPSEAYLLGAQTPFVPLWPMPHQSLTSEMRAALERLHEQLREAQIRAGNALLTIRHYDTIDEEMIRLFEAADDTVADLRKRIKEIEDLS